MGVGTRWVFTKKGSYEIPIEHPESPQRSRLAQWTIAVLIVGALLLVSVSQNPRFTAQPEPEPASTDVARASDMGSDVAPVESMRVAHKKQLAQLAKVRRAAPNRSSRQRLRRRRRRRRPWRRKPWRRS